MVSLRHSGALKEQETMNAYLKLRKPGMARAAFVFIPVPTGEIYSEIILDLDDEACDRQLKIWERNGYDPRRFMLWADVQGTLQTKHDRLLEVVIPGRGDIEPCAILTNYDAFFVSGEQLIERLFRYEPPAGAELGIAGGVLQHGDAGRHLEVPEGYERLPPPDRVRNTLTRKKSTKKKP